MSSLQQRVLMSGKINYKPSLTVAPTGVISQVEIFKTEENIIIVEPVLYTGMGGNIIVMVKVENNTIISAASVSNYNFGLYYNNMMVNNNYIATETEVYLLNQTKLWNIQGNKILDLKGNPLKMAYIPKIITSLNMLQEWY